MHPLRTIALLASLATMAHGGSVVIAWDKSPTATGYRVYQGIRLVKSVTGTQATITLPDSGIQTLGVTAYNASGESPMTMIRLVPLVIQVSNDLGIWTHRATIYDEVGTRIFYRTPRLSLTL